MRECIGGSFSPHGKLIAHDELKRISEPPVDLYPSLDDGELSLVRLFLRRYVTYCARRGRFAQMKGAADLFRELHTHTPLPGLQPNTPVR